MSNSEVIEELRAIEDADRLSRWANEIRELVAPLFAVELDLGEASFQDLQGMARAIYSALPRETQREWERYSYLWNNE